MLKKIRIDQLALGMYLHSICGSWLESPFWRTSFLLTDPKHLAAVRAGGAAECWIDTGKGADLPAPEPVRLVPPPPPVATEASRPAGEEALKPTTLERETETAARLRTQASQTVSSLMDDVRMGRALDVQSCVPLVSDIASSMQRNPGAMVGLVRLKTHDDYTYMHSVAVCTLMVALSLKMNKPAEEVREAGLAGLLHDMGKARMSLDVLNKAGKLSDEEFRLIRRHPRYGHELLQQAGVRSAIALDVCLHHHERPDGRGYPDGLSGPAFSVHARMGAICDVYDAITSRRPYKDPWGPAESMSLMSSWTRDGQFDPDLFRAFVNCIGIYPVGSLVRLESGRLAVVIEQHATSLVTPRVRVFYSIKSQMPIEVETVDLAAPGCRERIACRESNLEWKFPFLDELSIPGPELPQRHAA